MTLYNICIYIYICCELVETSSSNQPQADTPAKLGLFLPANESLPLSMIYVWCFRRDPALPQRFPRNGHVPPAKPQGTSYGNPTRPLPGSLSRATSAAQSSSQLTTTMKWAPSKIFIVYLIKDVGIFTLVKNFVFLFF